jgi:23S rRNA (cytosine1962-C5)-methyltransferase
MKEIITDLNKAFVRREELIKNLLNEQTNIFRIFHGTNEGHPGLTIDKYGEQILIQTFYETLSQEKLDLINDFLNNSGLEFTHIVYNDRSVKLNSKQKKQLLRSATEIELEEHIATELGVNYTIIGKHRGIDPLLFIDMRAGRRWIMENSKDKELLNLFAYTSGVGVAASVAGAKYVENVDFARSSLDFGVRNAEINDLDPNKITFIHEDVIPVLRQYAGLKVSGRGAKRHKYLKLEPKQFDIVYLDPPRWAKTPFGAIDILRDYQALLKPAILSTSEGGMVFCTNHLPQVELTDWINIVKRCANKIGRDVKSIDVIKPEEDFPSPDGNHPLKMLVLQF